MGTASQETVNQGVRIVVVDRDPEVGSALAKLLEDAGFEVVVTHDAEQGFAKVRRACPALMIVDTDLADCSGFEFATAARRLHPQQQIPVIFVAATGNPQGIVASHRVGGSFFLQKPLDPSVLLELVDKSLWMPHLVRRHIDQSSELKAPRGIGRLLKRRRSGAR